MTSLVHEYEDGGRDIPVRRFVNWIQGGKRRRMNTPATPNTTSVGIVGGLGKVGMEG